MSCSCEKSNYPKVVSIDEKRLKEGDIHNVALLAFALNPNEFERRLQAIGLSMENHLEDVEFLKFPHRHIFHICCKKKVTHDDRDIEIILLKRKINKYLNKMFPKTFGEMSCEMIAKLLLNCFELSYCKVLEDNENGAEIQI